MSMVWIIAGGIGWLVSMILMVALVYGYGENGGAQPPREDLLRD